MKRILKISFFVSLFIVGVFLSKGICGIVSKEPVSQANRIALVIGNGKYEHHSFLKNPPNDAEDISSSLAELGFDVVLTKNANHQEMMAAVNRFIGKMSEGTEGLFYYAGHGAQLDGVNYLIPVDGNISRKYDLRSEAVDVRTILALMQESGSSVNIIILDACRNTPTMRGINRSGIEGLARMNAPLGTIIAYATEPGDTAGDNEQGRNGIYTANLLKNIASPGLSINQVFMKTRAGVVRETNGDQIPWDSSSLLEDYYLTGRVNQKTDGYLASSRSGVIEKIQEKVDYRKCKVEVKKTSSIFDLSSRYDVIVADIQHDKVIMRMSNLPLVYGFIFEPEQGTLAIVLENELLISRISTGKTSTVSYNGLRVNKLSWLLNGNIKMQVERTTTGPSLEQFRLGDGEYLASFELGFDDNLQLTSVKEL